MIEFRAHTTSRFDRVDSYQLLLRVGIVASATLLVAVTRLAGDPPPLGVDAALVGLAILCALLPDTHVAAVMVAGLAVNWLTAVDDTTTPWAVAAAVLMAIFHSSTAAAGVATIGARWTRSMARRWSRRSLIVAAACVPTWTAVVLLDRLALGRSQALVAASLLLVAAGTVWLRRRSVDEESADVSR